MKLIALFVLLSCGFAVKANAQAEKGYCTVEQLAACLPAQTQQVTGKLVGRAEH